MADSLSQTEQLVKETMQKYSNDEYADAISGSEFKSYLIKFQSMTAGPEKEALRRRLAPTAERELAHMSLEEDTGLYLKDDDGLSNTKLLLLSIINH